MTEGIEPSQRTEANSEPLSHPAVDVFTLVLREADAAGPPDVFLIPGFDSTDARTTDVHSRTSLVYPLNARTFCPPNKGDYSIGFLAPRQPLNFIAQLGESQRNATLFSCGTCSVVLVSEDDRLIEATLTAAGGELYAWEFWKVVNSKLVLVNDSWKGSLPAENTRTHVHPGSITSASTIWLIRELSLNLNHYCQFASRYAPLILPEIDALADDVSELIGEITADESLQLRALGSPEADDGTDSRYPGDLFNAKKRLNTNIDLLVQLNSALVYCVTQAFAGTVPIRARYPHISQHSLLGTGTAWRAIQRTCSTVFTAFRDEHFPEELRANLNVYEDGSHPSAGPAGVPAIESRLNTRVIHFSARNGSVINRSGACARSLTRFCTRMFAN